MEEDPNEPNEESTSPAADQEEDAALVLTLTSSSDSLTEEDLFEPVSLRDLDLNNADLDSPNANPDRINNSRNPSSIFPPVKSRRKLSMSDTPPEILHLVDSAIMGSSESVEMLQRLVADAGDEASRSVVDALINTMGGAEGLDDMGIDQVPRIMHNTTAALIAVELVPYLPWEGDSYTYMSPRTRMVKGLLTILRSCVRNRAMCTGSGLLRLLLDTAEKMFVKSSAERTRWNFTPLCQCIQVLAGHSLSVIDLHHWLGVLKRSLMTEWALPLVVALEKAVGSKEVCGPKCSFEFDGEHSGLIGPGDSRWPFSNGYAFATWVYMESFADAITMAEDGVNMPRLFSYLFSFLSADNCGVEAYFHGQFLVVETSAGKEKKASIHFSHLFQPRCWYFVGLEHTCKQGLLGKAESELRLYVDGNLHESRPFEFPRVSKPLACCCIGTNPPTRMAGLQRRRRQCPLFGEIGPVYIFKEPIGQERMARLASRGGDALPSFGSAAGFPWLAVNEHTRSAAEDSAKLDMEIGGSLHLLYHPILLNGRSCSDASPSGAAALHQRPAEVLGQVPVASRLRPAESLWALAYGGPMALLPLTVSNVQTDSLEPMLGDFPLCLATASLSAPIFRIISMAIRHPGNNEELCRIQAPELLSRILHYLLPTISTLELNKQNGLSDEELVAAIVSLCVSQKNNHTLKVQLFSTLLLDLKIWSMCNYGLQKKLLSSLGDMVFTESLAMRDANALQMLLDGCRRCYWVVRETDSVDTFSLHGSARPMGEVNALVDELLVIVELLVGVASSSLANDDVCCLISFLVDCPQPNQVARVLHLIYRLVVRPNPSWPKTFSQSFISCGGIESLLFLLQREAKIGNYNILDDSSVSAVNGRPKDEPELETVVVALTKNNQLESPEGKESVSHEVGPHSEPLYSGDSSLKISLSTDFERMASASDSQLLKNLGGISFSISADSARNNVFNIDNGDGVVIGIINLLGALVTNGHLTFGSNAASQSPPSNIWSSLLHEEGSTMFGDKVSLLLFSLQKAFQAAPQRLMTTNVYMALLGAAINVSSTDDGLNLYDSAHCFQHVQLLLVLLCSLPYASTAVQARAIQDLLFLACGHPENRSSLTSMAEWPEWILEVLISNYEMGSSKDLNGVSIVEIEDLIHNFLIIVLEHSMRQKDGWKDVEATIHCAEWLSMIGGSSTGDQRVRREEALPIFKRRLLGGLLDFASRELQVQTEVIAAAAAGAAAEGLSPQEAKVEAENAAQLSVALAENAIVVLMLVEDHLRLQAQLSRSSKSASGLGSPATATSTTISRSNSLSRTGSESFDSFGPKRSSVSNDTGGISMDGLASMADANGQVSAAVMERLTAAAAAEPYESVRCAFVSYGSCVLDLADGWKYRSKLWYGVGVPSRTTFGGGGSGWEVWKSVLEKDSNGNWIELPLVKKSVAMLQALLLDECAIGGSIGVGCGSGTVMGGMKALYQLLDSDQPFLCMLRIVLASMREDDNGEDDIFMRNISIKDGISEGLSFQVSNMMPSENNNRLLIRKPRSALLWSVLGPILNMPVSESKRQRVLVASCILYSEVWHAIGRDGTPLRKQYVETILPPFVAILRRWRPLLAGIHELTSSDYENPLTVDDPALAADSLPLEAALSMISPGWAAAFASPPAAMALAMIAAGTAGGETVPPPRTAQLRRDTSLLERRTTRLHTFSSFQNPLETTNKAPPVPKDKAAAKAAALAAARDLERNAKIGSGRGLSAVAMATSAQRRSVTDTERAKRWSTSEAMASAWTECIQPFDSKSVSGRDFSVLSYKYVAVLVASFALARNMQRMEVDRRAQVEALNRYRASTGRHAWRKLLHCLIEMSVLFGPLGDCLCNPERVFWKLDSTVSSSRMRRYLKRNHKGSDHLKAATDYEERLHLKSSGESLPHANGSETSFNINFPGSTAILMVQAEALSTKDNIHDDDDDDDDEQLSANNIERQMVDGQRLSSSAEPIDCRNSGASSDQNLVHSTLRVVPVFVPSEADERIVLELPSLMVRPLKIIHGNFQITTKRISFIVGEANNDSSIADAHQNVPDKNRSWLISSLHQIYSRSYLLRKTALELFMVDRSSYFFDFGSIEGCKNAYRAILHARPPHLKNICMETQRPEKLLKRTQLMERWARWEISNFEYLMELNILAGRSYNDITQYPVFPWILADYCSKTLDLEDSSSYRDLSKPVGALNPDRLKKFQERYTSFEDPIIPKFHYGSHYSSAATALYYLVRVEPFTTLSVQLHGGKFDPANHIFSDVGSTWNGVLEDMNDVKELVPEMFYLPDILTNDKSFNCGATQLGGEMVSVKLPPWADNPVDFIHKHRRALESEYVSAHLHEWIDLIFGYKQRGEEAVLANNVFLYITYEGMVDVDKISDPVLQHAIQDQLVYTGQTPSQLLNVPHLKRRPLAEALHLQTIFHNPSKVKPYVVPSPELCNVPAAAISASDDSIIVVDINAPAANVAMHKWHANTPDGQGMPFLFHHGKSASGSTSGAFLRVLKGTGSSSEERQFPRALAFAASGIRSTAIVAITCDKEVITGGHADSSVKLISANGAKTIETAAGHCAPVTCLALSPDGGYLVTGSRDTTVILWRIRRCSSYLNNISGTPSSVPTTPTSPLIDSNSFSSTLEASRGRRIEGPLHVFRGHLKEVLCCCVSSDLGLIASCSNTSGVLLHSLRRGRLIRKLDVENVHAICLSPKGVVLIWNELEKKICTFTVNGTPIATKTLSPFAGSVNCIGISVDGENALLGTCCNRDDNSAEYRATELSIQDTEELGLSLSNKGSENTTAIPVPSVLFLNLHTLKLFHSLALGDGQDVTAMALNNDDRSLLVSTVDKQLIVFTDPDLSRKVGDQMIEQEGHALSPRRR